MADSGTTSQRDAALKVLRGERRRLTALFYDIANSTRMLSRLDPEDYAFVQRQVHTRAKAIIEGRGGYLDRTMGDGGCAYFGYPDILEDAPEAAVAAALDIVQEGEGEGQPALAGAALQIRVGVATGIVVLASPDGGDGARAQEFVGLAPTLAARAQSVAAPNSVVVCAATRNLAGAAFAYAFLGTFDLKGFEEPQALWQPSRRAAAIDRFTSFRRSAGPLVGRERELELGRREWARAKAPQGRLMCLIGEAGIGKSRLLSALRHEIEAEGADIRLFQCQPRGWSRPFGSVLDCLRQEYGTDEAVEAGLRALLGTSPGAERRRSLLMFLLNRRDAAGAGTDWADLPGHEIRQGAVDAMLGVLDAWAGGRPQLLLWEDMHWADSLTQDLLERVLDASLARSRLMIATSRSPMPEAVTGHPRTTSVALPRLERADVDRLVSALWLGLTVPDSVRAAIQRRSDGVPLFAEEMACLFREIAASDPDPAARWETLLADEGFGSLQDLVAARLAGLGDARQIAQVASVIGRGFSRPLLHALLADADPERIESGLGRLAAAGLVEAGGPADGAELRFRHVLIQEAAYQSLLRSDRRALHGRILALAEEGVAGDLTDEARAWHAERAGLFAQAAAFGLKAAEACSVRSAHREALRLLDAVEENLGRMGRSPETDGMLLRMLASRGPVSMALFGNGSPEAQAVYARGMEICRTLEPEHREAWFPVYWGWWITSPDSKTQHERSGVLVEAVRRAQDPEVRLQSLHCAWATAFHAGEHALCLDCVERGLALYDPQRAVSSRIRYGGHDAKVCALGERSLASWFAGNPDMAQASIREALAWAEEIQHLGSLCHALEYAVVLRRYQDDPEATLAAARKLREIADRHDLPGLRAKSQVFTGWAQARLSGFRGWPDEFDEGLDTLIHIETQENLSIYRDMQAELLGAAGEAERAAAVLRAMIDASIDSGQVFWLPELWRRLCGLQADPGEGLPMLQGALQLARSQGALLLAGRIGDDLARRAVRDATA